ncbi:hypothetical protein M422DRAFT_258499 [Sphaerobolus stellatus SS14]|uniref:Uncharacterized protein n=1 Tax=Sphaerobolus stellatus (strain SS14) TaxID=990650 RepID=A0A0C9VBF8_SPHS4|nr:hypothetical protein M422DRAFT_258499 [Sphaerobolus stellatus SS14]
MIEAEYNLNLNAIRGKEGNQVGQNTDKQIWMNTRQTRLNQLPDTSGSEALVFTPAGSLVETINDSEWKNRKGKKGQTKAVQGEAQSGVESNINERLSDREDDGNVGNLSGESIAEADKIMPRYDTAQPQNQD